MLIRSAIFYPMLWLRGIFLPIAKIIGAICTLCFLCMALVLHALVPAVVMGLLGFGTFMLRQRYDAMLLNLNPTGHELQLWQ